MRKLWASEAAKVPVMEFTLSKALTEMGLTYEQFVDVCILAGCDYCETIRGIAATSAYKLVKEKGDLAKVVASLDKEKHPVPEGVDYEEVRALFFRPDVTDPETVELKWSDPDEEGLKAFLVDTKGFNADRVASGIAKLKKARGSGAQMRVDSFFKLAPPPAAASGGGGGSSGGGGGGGVSGVKRKAPVGGKAGAGKPGGAAAAAAAAGKRKK